MLLIPTMEQTTLQKVEKVRALVAKGTSVTQACKQTKLNPNTYYFHKAKDSMAKNGKRPLASKGNGHAFTITVQIGGTPVTISGNHAAVMAILNKL